MHLWARIHQQLEHTGISEFSQIKMKQGLEVEEYAKRFIETILLPRYPNASLIWQPTYHEGEFRTRADALIYDNECQVFDVYEIKSSTSVDLENVKDVTFQTLIYEKTIPIRNVHILHLNKEYIRQGEINLDALFMIENVNEKVTALRETVFIEREAALNVMKLEQPDSIETCLNHDTCPCPKLCFPNLKPYSIYELMNKNKAKVKTLTSLGIMTLADITDEVKLNERQQRQIEAVREQTPFIDHNLIKAELEPLTYPLYFLDYETFGSAIPLFDGYKPQQNLVFQYSLHTVDELGVMSHAEHLSITQHDPALELLAHLSKDLGPTGSVLVWNKTFEMGRNKEMAERYPHYRDFLEGVNARVYDLADCIKKGYYIHPDFHGSWSIKKVLPVLVNQLSYQGLAIAKGEDAMVTWWRLIQQLSENNVSEPDWMNDTGADTQTIKDMLAYCKLDTLAMVEIWKKLTNFEKDP
jgi:hypothetical protein